MSGFVFIVTDGFFDEAAEFLPVLLAQEGAAGLERFDEGRIVSTPARDGLAGDADSGRCFAVGITLHDAAKRGFLFDA